ncbi:MAG: hypothetical protein R3214_01870 [Christiangramia sp.]|nr:hypothetical protein [Christiangramia sp.]
MKTRKALEDFKNDPVPFLIGPSQNAGCMGAAYEFLFNIEKCLRERKIRKAVNLYFMQLKLAISR